MALSVFRLLRKRLLLAVCLAPLASAASFATLSWYDFSAAAEGIAAESGEPACGAFGALVLFVTFGGAALQVLVSTCLVGLFAWLRPAAIDYR
ncbi:MAG TPA: hypothetical protein VER96_41520 [Polyangiaceae bacterium]|nr:hypothetical protein [Polyangiaceae bacterium]